MNTLHIFVDEVTPRLLFVVKLIFEDRGITVDLFNDPLLLDQLEGPLLIYSERYFEKSYLTLNPAIVLFDVGVKSYVVKKEKWCSEEVLTFNGVKDPFASIFYVASCYHEHLDKHSKLDQHGRVQGKLCFLHQMGWLNKVIVDRWAMDVIHWLQSELKVQFAIQQIPFQLIPTFDVDNAYAYRFKSGIRRLLSPVKDILKLDRERLAERKEVLAGLKPDPFDTFGYITDIAKRGYLVKLFWLLGDFGEYDRNLPHTNAAQIRLIRKMDKVTEIGLHPSYRSNENFIKLQEEKRRIESILGHPVLLSRQHFLKLEHDKTYKALLKSGFTHDYTMGFSDLPGFRAGVSRAIPWFDLKQNRITELWIHPLAYMDGTLHDYLKMNPDQAKGLVKELVEEVKAFGGDFIFLWHNDTIGNFGAWSNWNEVLEFTLSLHQPFDKKQKHEEDQR